VYVVHGVQIPTANGTSGFLGLGLDLAAASTPFQLALTPDLLVVSALCVIRSPSYLVWSRTFLLGAGLTDLGDFGRDWGQNKAVVGIFNGPVVYVNVGIGLIFLARAVVLVKNFTFGC
jgi:hypothetical protein